MNRKLARYAISCPEVIIRVLKVTREALIWEGAVSAMKTGAVTDAKPTPKPTSTLPVIHVTILIQDECSAWPKVSILRLE